ncbi:sulfotransferase 2B [Actinidia rufa]|uniref:Sulfotransferase 2B n=1 Tax=Actinidia rufa TaxID=165716 RepID=A0A7J0DQB2_9ERIC|nr:sulfotransferase 2B [Actinidia rufa]
MHVSKFQPNLDEEMPDRDEIVPRVPAQIHNSAPHRLGYGARQRQQGHVGPEKPWPSKVGKVRNVMVGVGIHLVLQEGYEVMGVGREQRVVLGPHWKTVAVDDDKDQGFQPGGAAFGDCSEYDVGVLCLKVSLA